MMLNSLTYNMVHVSSIEITILGILIALLNLRALSLTAKAGFLNQIREKLMVGLIPILLISIIIMLNQLISAITTN